MQANPLDQTLSALADPTRRAILARLAHGEATVNELAAPFDITLPAVSRALEGARNRRADLARPVAQGRPCRLGAGAADGARRLARALPALLGRELRPDGRLSGRDHERRTAMTAQAEARTADDELLITRAFDAPVSLVFRLWEEREHMIRWWGPKDFTCTELELDFRPGGAWRACIVSERYGESWMGGQYPRDRARPAHRLDVRLGGRSRPARHRDARHRDLRRAGRQDRPDLPPGAVPHGREPRQPRRGLERMLRPRAGLRRSLAKGDRP